jgi:O-antigen ligase
LIEPQSSNQLDKARLRQTLRVALIGIGTLLLALVGIGLGLFMGKKIAADEWPILVTATGLATFIAIALINQRHALLLWIVLAPFARFVYLNIELGRGIPNLTLNRIMTGTLLVLILAQAASLRRKLARATWVDFLLVLFCFGAANSLPATLTPIKQAVQSCFDLLIVPAAIYFLARNLITDRREMRGMMLALLVIGFYLAFLATREQLTGDVWFYPEDRSIQYTASIRRVVGLLGNPAYIALTINIAVPWVWYLCLNARRHRMKLLLVVALMMAGVYFCMNRSGWGGLLASMIVMALFVPRFRRIFLVLLAMGAVVGVVYGAIILTSSVVQERLTAQGPLDYRVETWDVAFQMIRDHPLFGVGYDNFSTFYKRYAHWDVYLRAVPTPHNTYLWVMLMGGVVALVPFLVFLVVMIFSALKVRREARQQGDTWLADITGVFLASMAAVLAPAFVMDILSGYYNTMVMFLVIGGYFGMVAGERRRASAPPVAASPVAASPVTAPQGTAPSISGETAGEG